jgi:outer membrane immunogenic protein
MKVRIQGMLATAAGAALFASAGIALADGMPGGGSYARPALWSGFYVGGESGWERDHTEFTNTAGQGGVHWDRNGIAAGLFLGYQHQFGPLVVGVELNLIGNEFDNHGGNNPTPLNGVGNCSGTPNQNCVGRITDTITVGPRVGWAIGNFMPYATGGWATGSINFRAIPSNGIATDWGDSRSDGWFAGGGVDWKLARHVVVGIEYRHTDLGWSTMQTAAPSNGAFVETLRARGDSDSIMVRGSLLFGGRDYAPLK